MGNVYISACFAVLAMGACAEAQLQGPENIIPNDAKVALLRATECTLVSLEPKDGINDEKGLYGWPILGETAIKSATQCRSVLAGVEQSVAAPGEWGAKCFDPRHALRVVHEGHQYDFVICFECRWTYIYSDGERTGEVALNAEARKQFQPLLDGILKAKGVHLAEKPRYLQD